MSDASQCLHIINTLIHAYNVRQKKKKNDKCSMQRVSSLLNTLSKAMKLLNFCADNIIIR